MDIASVGGILLALVGIIGGLMIEGGSIAQITQPTAMLIVLGGTVGAVMMQFPLNICQSAMKQFWRVFFAGERVDEAIIAQLVEFAVTARREGIVKLDAELSHVKDSFLRQALMLAIDGTEPAAVRQIMQLELENDAEFEERVPQVFESAGGFSPTVGIIGAVIGLIQVMQHLDNIEEVGHGIAIAFVATIYGIGLANLIFLPAAGKLRIRQQQAQMIKEMMLEGVISIQEGMNPRMIEIKLRTFLFEGNRTDWVGGA
jgi:chemotaxis protein MotA